MFHSNIKLIINDLDTDETFKWVQWRVITGIESFVTKDWIVKTILEHSICVYKDIPSMI